MANSPKNDYIFCTEYGLEPAVYNYNYGKSTAYYSELVLINKSVKDPSPVSKNGEILVKPSRILYEKILTLSNFNGYDKIYVGRKTKFYLMNIPFDFSFDKWRFKDLTGHPLNNTKFNVYDRPKIRSILNTFLTSRQEEVFNVMYREIATSSGLEKFLNILTVVVEYQDRFLDLLVPYEEKFLPVPDGLLNASDMNGTNGTDGTSTNPANGNPTAANNNLLLGLGLLAVGTYALKKKKVI